ncbi:MAG: hypothetical protein IB616_01220 [Methanosarcinales archaeon]|nr:MAG: hypothetical protein IB616_01220 [Methanosarcinales archaeon]
MDTSHSIAIELRYNQGHILITKRTGAPELVFKERWYHIRERRGYKEPRVNKPDSRLDRAQKTKGEYYYQAL